MLPAIPRGLVTVVWAEQDQPEQVGRYSLVHKHNVTTIKVGPVAIMRIHQGRLAMLRKSRPGLDLDFNPLVKEQTWASTLDMRNITLSQQTMALFRKHLGTDEVIGQSPLTLWAGIPVCRGKLGQCPWWTETEPSIRLLVAHGTSDLTRVGNEDTFGPGGSWAVLVPSAAIKPKHVAKMQSLGAHALIVPSATHILQARGAWKTSVTDTRKATMEFTLWISGNTDQNKAQALCDELQTLDTEGHIPYQACPFWLRELRGSQVGRHYDAKGQLAASDGSLLSGKAGAGVAFADGRHWNGPVGGTQTVFRGELTGATEAVNMSDPDQPLALLIDAQAVLNVVTKCVRKLDVMDPTFHDDGDLIKGMVEAIFRRKEHTTLIKCKSHRGDPMNGEADVQAKRAAETAQVCDVTHPWKIHFRHGKSESNVTHKGNVDGKLRTANSLDLARKKFQGNDTFASKYLTENRMGREFLKHQLGASQPTATVKRTLQMISGTLPLQSNLYKWKIAASPACLLCNAGNEGFTHVQCWCPALKEARIKGHHLIWRNIMSFLTKTASASFCFFTEERMESLANLDIGQSDSEAGREWSKACTELEPAFAMARQAQAGGALGRILERLTHCMSMLDDDPDCGFQDVIQEEILNEYLADAQACPECSPVYVREITRELERLRINASIKSEFVDGDSGCQILNKVTDRIRNLATDLAKQRPDGMAINLVDRKVFLLEFTRASDYDPDFVSRTDSKKRARYSRSVNELKKLLPGRVVVASPCKLSC